MPLRHRAALGVWEVDTMNESGTPTLNGLRVVLFIDAIVFLTASLLNMGATLPLGFAVLNFPVPIWQAGVGEAVIGLVLLASALSGRIRLSWLAFGLSV